MFECTRETCAFAYHIDEIKKLCAVIIAVSPDSLDRHGQFAELYGLAFRLAADPALEVARTCESPRLNGKGMLRVTYVIEAQGVIRLALHHELLINTHWKKAIEVLKPRP